MNRFISFLLLMLTSCTSFFKPTNQKTSIDLEAVDYIVISRGFNDVNKVRLNEEQTEAFVEKWNRSRSKGLYKFVPEYWLTVYLKDGTQRDFRVNGKLVKEGNDWSYSVGDAGFFERMLMEE